MTGLEPYEPPTLYPRGWRVGPTQQRTNPAGGDCAALPADANISVTADMNVATATGDALVPGLVYTPVYNFDMLPAVAGGDGLVATDSRTIPVSMDVADGGGGAALVPTMSISIPIFDDFSGASDFTGLGPNWTNRNGTMYRLSGVAIPATPPSTFIAATYNSPAAQDDVEVSVVLSSASYDENFIILGANSSGVGAVCEFVSSAVNILTTTGWNLATGATTRVSGISSTWTSGDTLTFRRVGAVYTALKNGVAISGATWTDGSSAVPRNSSYRLVGLGGYCTAGNNYRTIDSFLAT